MINDIPTIIEHVKPADIEKRSFEIITQELNQMGITVDEKYAHIVKRAIHTTADFDYANNLYFSENCLEKLNELILSGATIITDTNMGLSGINKSELAKYGIKAECFMADADVAKEAKEKGVTRASVSMQRAAGLNEKIIFVVGNAPTALIELKKMMEEGVYTPDFVIGVPVGFVNVEVSKEMIIDSGIPCIVARGRKGGSNVAAAIVNAVLYKLRDEENGR